MTLALLLAPLLAQASPTLPLTYWCEQRARPRASSLTTERRLIQGIVFGEQTIPDAPRLSLWSDAVPPTLPEVVVLPLDMEGASPAGGDVVRRLAAAHEAGARTVHVVLQRWPGLGLGSEIRQAVAAGRPAWPEIEAAAKAHIHARLQGEVLDLARDLYEADTIEACKAAAKPAATFRARLRSGASIKQALTEGHTWIDVVFQHAAEQTTDYVTVYPVRLAPTGTRLVVTGPFDGDDVDAMVRAEGPVWLVDPSDGGAPGTGDAPVVPFSQVRIRRPPSVDSPGAGSADCRTEVVFDATGKARSATADCETPFAEAAERAVMGTAIHPHEAGAVTTHIMIRFRGSR